MIPVNLKMHWCLCVVKPKKKAVVYYDSMGRENEECIDVSCCAIEIVIDHSYCLFIRGMFSIHRLSWVTLLSSTQ